MRVLALVAGLAACSQAPVPITGTAPLPVPPEPPRPVVPCYLVGPLLVSPLDQLTRETREHLVEVNANWTRHCK